MRRFDEALACCDEVIRRFGMTKADRLLRRVASAMYRRSVLLGNFGRQDKEVEGYDELIARFGDSAPVFIGQSRTLRVPRSGRLVLGVNDSRFDDNTGQFNVRVDRN